MAAAAAVWNVLSCGPARFATFAGLIVEATGAVTPRPYPLAERLGPAVGSGIQASIAAPIWRLLMRADLRRSATVERPSCMVALIIP